MRSVWVPILGVFVCGLAGFAQVVLPEAKASGRPIFLWTVQSETSKSYLLGSLHMAPKTMYPLPRAMEEAFFACDSLVVEMDPTALPAGELTEMILSHAVHPVRISYKDELNEATFSGLQDILDQHGLKLEAMKTVKPWYLAQLISLYEMRRLGAGPENGIDRHFLQHGKPRGEVIELEGLENQLALFDGLSLEEQMRLLACTVRDMSNLEAVMGDLVRVWSEGAESELAILLRNYIDSCPGLKKLFSLVFSDRNRGMLRRISECLATERNCFIVVGAGHLVGGDGLLVMLRDAGYHVEQVRAEILPAVP